MISGGRDSFMKGSLARQAGANGVVLSVFAASPEKTGPGHAMQCGNARPDAIASYCPCQGMRAVEQRITDTVPNLVAPQTERAPEAVDIASVVAVRRGRAGGRAQTWQVVDGQQILERRDVV